MEILLLFIHSLQHVVVYWPSAGMPLNTMRRSSRPLHTLQCKRVSLLCTKCTLLVILADLSSFG